MPRSLEDDFSKMLIRTGALQFGMFTLSGGRLSPYYLDLRVIPSFPDAFRACADLLAKNARSVEGILTPGERVLLVDDVITTGKNILTALQSIRGEGGVVENALVLLDREEGGGEHLQKEGVKLHSVAKISDVAKKLLDMDAITKTQFEELSGETEEAE